MHINGWRLPVVRFPHDDQSKFSGHFLSDWRREPYRFSICIGRRTMTDLITRLSKLGAPDREVDAEIYIRFNIPADRAGRIDYSNGMVGWWPKDGPSVSAVTVPAYTASVDETIRLAEKVLPGWEYILRRRFAELRHPSKFEHDARGYAFNTATALLIA